MSSADQEHAKSQEEMRLLRAQRRTAEWTVILDGLKVIALVVTSIVLFILIQRPESILNQRRSDDEIARERAKLVLQLLNESDPTKQALGLGIIRAAYPGPNAMWLDSVGGLFTRYAALEEKRAEITADLELGDTNAASRPADPTTDTKRQQLESVNSQIREVRGQLRDLASAPVPGDSKRPDVQAETPNPRPEVPRTVPPQTGWVYYGWRRNSGEWVRRHFTTNSASRDPQPGDVITALQSVNVRAEYIQYDDDNPRTTGLVSPRQQLSVREVVQVPHVNGESSFWWVRYSR